MSLSKQTNKINERSNELQRFGFQTKHPSFQTTQTTLISPRFPQLSLHKHLRDQCPFVSHKENSRFIQLILKNWPDNRQIFLPSFHPPFFPSFFCFYLLIHIFAYPFSFFFLYTCESLVFIGIIIVNSTVIFHLLAVTSSVVCTFL